MVIVATAYGPSRSEIRMGSASGCGERQLTLRRTRSNVWSDIAVFPLMTPV